MPRPRYTHRVRVAYVDTDAAQVVHHATYLRYFEQSRIEFLRTHGWDYAAWLAREQLGLPVAEVQIRYKAPAYFDDALEVDTWCTKASRAYLVFAHQVRREGRVLTDAEIKCPCTTMQGAVRRVPMDLLRVCLGDEFDERHM